LSSTDFQHHVFFADYGSKNQNAFAAHILYMWKLELIVHIILYRLLLLAQLLEEKVEETLQRIAQGQFGGWVNGTTSGGALTPLL
jgi:hypothetical protein